MRCGVISAQVVVVTYVRHVVTVVKREPSLQSAENYEDVPEDLVKLGFVPAEKIGELRASGLTVAIGKMLKLASQGGGPKGCAKRTSRTSRTLHTSQEAHS